MPLSLRGNTRRIKRTISVIRLHTFAIVAMAACGYAFTVQDTAASNAESQTRFLQGLVAGIGFIGGGVIILCGVIIL
ncbi:transporter (plasmid) [Rhizobium rhizogenes K84]|uniref:Transporter n=1 Tax=Rhizobium rhizogenes (strain K84 / ATCC BAA-868) TaxID=311403 RepID=B9JQF1_RHIR8|nr:transporter [Rhizobium rhizogenes K84]